MCYSHLTLLCPFSAKVEGEVLNSCGDKEKLVTFQCYIRKGRGSNISPRSFFSKHIDLR